MCVSVCFRYRVLVKYNEYKTQSWKLLSSPTPEEGQICEMLDILDTKLSSAQYEVDSTLWYCFFYHIPDSVLDYKHLLLRKILLFIAKKWDGSSLFKSGTEIGSDAYMELM